MPFVSSCQEGANREFECHNAIVFNSLQQSNVKRFQMSPFFVFTLKTDRFQNAAFSNLCFFIGVFEKLRFHSGAMWTQGHKRIRLAPFSYENGAVWTGPQSLRPNRVRFSRVKLWVSVDRRAFVKSNRTGKQGTAVHMNRIEYRLPMVYSPFKV